MPAFDVTEISADTCSGDQVATAPCAAVQGEISLHDVQALIAHLGQPNGVAPGSVPVAAPGELNAWIAIWGHMLALRQTRWPLGRLTPRQRAQWHEWAQAQPDSPCVAICSTAQGDAVCRGCRRTFDEVKAWPAMALPAKRLVWARLLSGM
jgi:predicted Fe-S protein YdhL (DUF1289 family)